MLFIRRIRSIRGPLYDWQKEASNRSACRQEIRPEGNERCYPTGNNVLRPRTDASLKLARPLGRMPHVVRCAGWDVTTTRGSASVARGSLRSPLAINLGRIRGRGNSGRIRETDRASHN